MSKKFFSIPTTNAKIPSIGYGTGTAWFRFGNDKIDETLVSTIGKAIELGFTHIDGAEVYGTEPEIGAALKKANLSRDKLFLTTKYFAGDSTYTYHSPDANPLEALKSSLKRLGVEYVDLYLLHSPFIKKEVYGFTTEEAWGYLEEAQKLGLAKNIGVSNYEVEDLKKILAVAKVKPQVHQIEFSAYLQNQTPGIVEFTKSEDILIEAYSPLGPITKGKPGPLDPILEELSTKYGKTEAQVLLRWVLQNGIVPLTTSAKESRIKEYLDVYDFELTDAEVAKITTVGKEKQIRQYWLNEYGKY